MTRKTDFIEVGQGVDSKVIGGNNSISEYMTVILSLIAFVGQGLVIAWFVIVLVLYYWGIRWVWAMGLSLVITLALGVGALWGILRILDIVKRIQEPTEQPRDERGRWRSTTYKVNQKHVGTFYTAENGDSEYIAQWGGGGRGSD